MDELKITSANKIENEKLVIDIEFEFVSETVVVRCFARHNDYIRNKICYTSTPLSKVELIILKFSDILGCLLVMDAHYSQTLVIFYYPQLKTTNETRAVKKRRRRILFLKSSKANEPMKLTFWRDQIVEHCLAEFRLCPPVGRPKRKLLAFINPFSGPGRALQIFQGKVLPVFSEAGLYCKVFVTEKAQQAQEWVRTMRLDEWDSLVVVSGDGLVFEVLNGLAAREDAPAALRIPLGIVPGGSGNALAVSCCFDARSSVQFDYALDAAFTIARPILRPLKLVHIQSKKQDFVSFIGLGWGILADIDIESEKFRRLLGGSRFFASGVVRFANLRSYHGRLSFKLAPNAAEYSIRRRFSATKNSESCPNFHADKNNNENETVVDNGELEHEVAQEAEHFDASFHNKMGVGDTEIEFIHHLKINDSNPHFRNLKSKIMKPIKNCKLAAHLSQFDKFEMPALDQPVPDDWQRIEGQFYSVYLIYLNHLGSSCPFMPASRFDDDVMYLTVVRTQTTRRLDLLKFLTNMSNGGHLDVPCVEVYPVVAFRMERSNEDNILTVDGEHVKCVGPVQACLSHLKANVMTSEQCSG